MKRIMIFIFMGFISTHLSAHVGCTGIIVDKIQSSVNAGFHGMDKGGAAGPMIFVPVDVTRCTAYNNEDLANGAFLVIDHYGETGNDLRAYWASMLLTAKASGGTVNSSSDYIYNWEKNGSTLIDVDTITVDHHHV